MDALPRQLAEERIREARQGLLQGQLPNPTSGKQVLLLPFLGEKVKT